ncbi:hypothetical protein ACPPVQ_08745 [Diaminobutyricibacter sp. McL0618]|uniref:hypothetical protein n=1 Tax=Leifsonia sp. McL0618 TaxID=3415677 RepID=UPI003CE95D89
MKRRVGAANLAVIAAILALVITGCTAPQPAPANPDVPVSAKTPGLEPLGSLTGTVLLRLEDQRGGGIYGPYKHDGSNSIAVDFNCLGAGSATVTVAGVGALPNRCSASGSALRVIFGVQDGVDSFTVQVEAPNKLQWSLGVTEVKR